MKIFTTIVTGLAAAAITLTTLGATALPSSADITMVRPEIDSTSISVAADPPAGEKIENSISIRIQRQEKNSWCWAAVGASVARFHNRSISQLDFCKRVFQLADSEKDCPDTTASFSEMNFALTTMNIGGSVTGSLTMDTIKTEIDAGRPVISGIQYTDGFGHVQVISGYNTATQSIQVRDPLGDRGWIRYDDYVSNNSYSWVSSIIGVG